MRADAIDDLLRQELAAHRIPGAALKILRHGIAVKTACYGFANLELAVPVSTNTVFEIGSVTKQFTAACILLLQQQGKLSSRTQSTGICLMPLPSGRALPFVIS